MGVILVVLAELLHVLDKRLNLRKYLFFAEIFKNFYLFSINLKIFAEQLSHFFGTFLGIRVWDRREVSSLDMSLNEDDDRYFFDLVAPDAYTHGLEHAGTDDLYLRIGSLKLLQHFGEVEHKVLLVNRLLEFGEDIMDQLRVYLDATAWAGSNDKHKV